MTLYELAQRDVIQMSTGERLGRVDDILFDETNACVQELVLYGRLKWFGLLGREDDTHIRWSDICSIGRDVVLVQTEHAENPRQNKNEKTAKCEKTPLAF
jgi:YlmC/YmxH family sporulation protein